MIIRKRLEEEILASIDQYPITAILGPRQCGKTTISRQIAKKFTATFFDLEDPVSVTQLSDAPKIALESLKDLVIIDEVQRMPEIFPILRVLADRPDNQAKLQMEKRICSDISGKGYS